MMEAIVYLGMPCSPSAPALAALLAAGYDVRAAVLARQGEMNDGVETPVERIATEARLPILRPRAMDPALVDEIARWGPEAVVVACFPWKLPPSLLALPQFGCLNVHPSLLPAGRGPEPVFWTLRRGERQTGATVHLMDAGLDTGPIVAQATYDVSPGIRAPELETRLMILGGQILVDALPKLASGALSPTPQDDALVTPAPVPGAADFMVPTNLPAGWAYAFVRGVAPLGGPLAVLVGTTGRRLPVRDALDHDPFEAMAKPVSEVRPGVVRVRFRPGWVRFLLP